ncbi:MAG: glycine zipper family protein [Candidatus Binatia bacterium]
MMKRLAVVPCLVLLWSSASVAQWQPTVDTYGSSRAQYVNRDMEECRRLAQSAQGGGAVQQGVRGAATGGLVGAAGGAAIGAALGNAGRGAAVGAAAGGIGRGVGQASQADQAFRRAFSNCMRQRGHRVIN